MSYTPLGPIDDNWEDEKFRLGYRLGSLEKENEILKEVNSSLRQKYDEVVEAISGRGLLTSSRPTSFEKFLKVKE